MPKSQLTFQEFRRTSLFQFFNLNAFQIQPHCFVSCRFCYIIRTQMFDDIVWGSYRSAGACPCKDLVPFVIPEQVLLFLSNFVQLL